MTLERCFLSDASRETCFVLNQNGSRMRSLRPCSNGSGDDLLRRVICADSGAYRRCWTAWRIETLAQVAQWPDAELVGEGLRVLEELARPSPTDILLATDLHAGNVLRSERQPWLVIDPKPFIGDPTYDLVQHLLNCELRLYADPLSMIKRLADLAEVDIERLRLWTFARAAADPREDWTNPIWMDIARALAP